MKKNRTRKYQRGAVSLFSVIFAMLLMTIITTSFLRIMIADQVESTNNDLAQSAYDSAQAGVEDAKRALIWYANKCKTGEAACNNAEDVVSSTTCNEAIINTNSGSAWSGSGGEIKVQQSTQVDESGNSVDQALDQAYTCVTLQLNTDDYVSAVNENESIIVPLQGTSSFDTVTIQWYSQDDLSTAGGTAKLGTSTQLKMAKTWPTDRPSVLRTQLMQVGSSFKLSDFDSVTSDSKSDANTVFLYPTTDGVNSTSFVARDSRSRTEASSLGFSPLPTKCVSSIPSGGYSCSMTLALPTAVGESSRSTSTTTYLRLTSLYTSAHVRITLGNNAKFNGVQPIVDSTGRANDVFRRVQSRVNLYDTSGFPYPDGAIDVSSNLCKNFSVTDSESDYSSSCTP